MYVFFIVELVCLLCAHKHIDVWLSLVVPLENTSFEGLLSERERSLKPYYLHLNPDFTTY